VNLSNPAAAPVVQGTGSVAGYIIQNGNSGTFDGVSAVNGAVVANGASSINAGGDAAWGVNWNSWQGGAPTVNGTAAVGLAHVIQSTNLTTADQLATLGSTGMTATYNYLGGPAPANQAGTQGTINSLSVAVNFGTQTISNYAVAATVGTQAWQAKGSGSIAQFTGAGIQLGGTCTGCNPANPGTSPAANGSASGAFVGPAAERMITSFGLKSTNQQAISGAGYLGR